ncbi:hypothetical protein [Achromobacter arsenitoxydans]|uniref:Uncharacterized protein n=1 Tax=Achromobacter arsenitoxydans SY8 TaxID=477184 RepID=H0F2J7_9BURK|nr:hypothetical protein [Achromobacter arsenitoxydans]EHK67608.1 hypothetical protein KYC_04927 [Achromobacter arsenitoxydans SY8]
MPPTAIKWLVSIVLGLLIGSASFGVTNPLLQVVFGLQQPAGAPYAPLDDTALERMQIASAILYVLIAVAAALLLARIANMRRRIGWGCAALGVMLLLTVPIALLQMDPALHTGGGADARDANTALFFFLMIFGLPYLGGGLLLTIGGAVLIRKGGGKPA